MDRQDEKIIERNIETEMKTVFDNTNNKIQYSNILNI